MIERPEISYLVDRRTNRMTGRILKVIHALKLSFSSSLHGGTCFLLARVWECCLSKQGLLVMRGNVVIDEDLVHTKSTDLSY